MKNLLEFQWFRGKKRVAQNQTHHDGYYQFFTMIQEGSWQNYQK